jgi:hypothetical protein
MTETEGDVMGAVAIKMASVGNNWIKTLKMKTKNFKTSVIIKTEMKRMKFPLTSRMQLQLQKR